MTLTAPVWPRALKDETPMPFATWQIMDLVNGQRTVNEIAQRLGLSVDTVIAALGQAQTWTERAVQREQSISDDLLDTVTQCLKLVVGPMAEFMVDDAYDEVGASAPLSQLLGSIARQLNESHLQAFVRQLRSRGLA